jgi:hypothetical protein
MNDILLMIILIINTVAVLGTFIVLIALLTKKNKEEKNASPPIENIIKRIEYSDKMLEYTRSVINSITYIEFKTFIDRNEISKVSKSQLIDLAKTIASKVKNSINDNNIDFNYVIFSTNYFDEYIINFSVDLLNQLWEKTIEDKSE